eukprot:scaffold3243_cov111-Skeletonema_dohrnii-CCMP3373.AAC.3
MANKTLQCGHKLTVCDQHCKVVTIFLRDVTKSGVTTLSSPSLPSSVSVRTQTARTLLGEEVVGTIAADAEVEEKEFDWRLARMIGLR